LWSERKEPWVRRGTWGRSASGRTLGAPLQTKRKSKRGTREKRKASRLEEKKDIGGPGVGSPKRPNRSYILGVPEVKNKTKNGS